jgi:hypothetical protein
MRQSRIDSFMEAMVNVLVGFLINLVANLVLLPVWFGIEPDIASFAGLGALYTLVSIARSYAIRRLFNGQSIWAALRGTVDYE